MVEEASFIYYDGAMCDRAGVLERIERDGVAYLAHAIAGFEGDDTAWLLLIEELKVPDDLDALDLGTFARGYAIRVDVDGVVVSLSDRLPRKLAATLEALSSRDWCSSPRLHGGSIALQVCGLDRATGDRIRGSIARRARRTEDAMRRAIANLVSLIAPAELPRLTEDLRLAAARVEALASAKIERVDSACSGTGRGRTGGVGRA